MYTMLARRERDRTDLREHLYTCAARNCNPCVPQKMLGGSACDCMTSQDHQHSCPAGRHQRPHSSRVCRKAEIQGYHPAERRQCHPQQCHSCPKVVQASPPLSSISPCTCRMPSFCALRSKWLQLHTLHNVHLQHAEPFSSPKGRPVANGSTSRGNDLQLPEGDDLLGMTAHTPAGAPQVSNSLNQGALSICIAGT